MFKVNNKDARKTSIKVNNKGSKTSSITVVEQWIYSKWGKYLPLSNYGSLYDMCEMRALNSSQKTKIEQLKRNNNPKAS